MEGSVMVLLEALPRLGRWLRELSLSGPGGNAAAWAVVLALAALPALGLLWRGRCRWDWLLALAGGEILGGLFFLVNPTLLGVPLEGEPAAKLWGLTVAGGTGAVLLAWAVLRWLRALERGASGRSVERLLSWAALMAGALAILAQGLDLAGKLQNVASSNTAPGLDLVPTYLTLCLLAAADLVPSLLGCAVLRWGGRPDRCRGGRRRWSVCRREAGRRPGGGPLRRGDGGAGGARESPVRLGGRGIGAGVRGGERGADGAVPGAAYRQLYGVVPLFHRPAGGGPGPAVPVLPPGQGGQR